MQSSDIDNELRALLYTAMFALFIVSILRFVMFKRLRSREGNEEKYWHLLFDFTSSDIFSNYRKGFHGSVITKITYVVYAILFSIFILMVFVIQNI